ncbi:MAG: hypothetical protein RMI93_02170 [Caldimicrobium sp.]|nr:hypothetical protein [Caldimicrobium sp.]MDW8182397.1 hypothetical protein [Caldimicrobium sp.]
MSWKVSKVKLIFFTIPYIGALISILGGTFILYFPGLKVLPVIGSKINVDGGFLGLINVYMFIFTKFTTHYFYFGLS